MKMKMKIFIPIIMFFVLSSIVYAQNYELTYNSITSNFDYVLMLNQSGYDMIADNFIGNMTVTDIWVNISGDTMTGNLNMSGNELTDIGKLIVAGLTISQNIIPDTTELYSIGNSTVWFKDAYIKIIHGEDIYTDNLNASEINSTDINSDTIDVDDNLTIAGYKILNDSNNLVIILT